MVPRKASSMNQLDSMTLGRMATDTNTSSCGGGGTRGVDLCSGASHLRAGSTESPSGGGEGGGVAVTLRCSPIPHHAAVLEGVVAPDDGRGHVREGALVDHVDALDDDGRGEGDEEVDEGEDRVVVVEEAQDLQDAHVERLGHDDRVGDREGRHAHLVDRVHGRQVGQRDEHPRAGARRAPAEDQPGQGCGRGGARGLRGRLGGAAGRGRGRGDADAPETRPSTKREKAATWQALRGSRTSDVKMNQGENKRSTVPLRRRPTHACSGAIVVGREGTAGRSAIASSTSSGCARPMICLSFFKRSPSRLLRTRLTRKM